MRSPCSRASCSPACSSLPGPRAAGHRESPVCTRDMPLSARHRQLTATAVRPCYSAATAQDFHRSGRTGYSTATSFTTWTGLALTSMSALTTPCTSQIQRFSTCAWVGAACALSQRCSTTPISEPFAPAHWSRVASWAVPESTRQPLAEPQPLFAKDKVCQRSSFARTASTSTVLRVGETACVL